MSTLYSVVRPHGALAALALGLLAAGHAVGQPAPLPPTSQARVNAAIDKGARYLRSTQLQWGTWHKDKGDKHASGYASLPALTLLECGVPPIDPGVQGAANFVRFSVAKLDRTYDVALAILLLDRLGDKRDRPFIEILALRLLAGQTPTGGWSYKVPLLTQPQHKDFLRVLSDPKLSAERVPPYMRGLPVFQDPRFLVMKDPPKKYEEPQFGTSDNSNTQFGLLALWVAQRHGIPVRRGLELVALRFLVSQEEDGSWLYRKSTPNDGTRQAGTCAGLLGLAVGSVLADVPVPPEKLKPPPAQVASLLAAPLMPNVALTGDTLRRQSLEVRRAEAGKDPRLIKGLLALEKWVGQPRGNMDSSPMKDLYFLWSLERVAVLYSLQRIGTKDWYLWGAEILVANQKADGHWEGGGYHGSSHTIDTCFALLFLKRANLTADLAERLPIGPEALTKEVVSRLPEAVTPAPERPPVTPEPERPPPAPEIPIVRDPLPEVPGHRPPPSGHEPVRPAPRREPSPAPAAEPAAEEGSSFVGWLLAPLLLALVVVPAVLAFRALRSRGDDTEDEEDEEEES